MAWTEVSCSLARDVAALVGMNLFVIKGITEASLSEVVRGAAPYVGLMSLRLVLMLLLPGLATWLPYSAGYGQ